MTNMSRIWIVHSTQISAYVPDIPSIYINPQETLSYALHPTWEKALINIKEQYPTLDPTIHLALLATQQLSIDRSHLHNFRWACNIGSARGLTHTWEERHQHFLRHQSVPPDTSPLTTAGSIASKVLAFLAIPADSIAFDHSATCNSSATAIANGYAWLKAGMCDLFLAGGAEMPLTPFTVAQMQALRIYSKETEYPLCKPFNKKYINTFTLGYGTGLLLLTAQEQKPSQEAVEIEAVGYASEIPPSLTGLSLDAKHIQSAIQSAIRFLPEDDRIIDLIIPHAPGTAKGDYAEYQAYQAVFDELPFIFPTKHLTGHTFGASTAINIALAINIFNGIMPPYPNYGIFFNQKEFPNEIRRIAVVSAGFGGMAMVIILKK
jgi:3-oxoacyl-(acyl-carrier-protein) synthase